MTTVEIDVDLDSLGPNDLEAIGVPKHCPSWCRSNHRQAVEEGCDAELARVHLAGDYAFQTREIHGETFTWGLTLYADPQPNATWWTRSPFIELETHPVGDLDRRAVVRFDTGSARILARQLLHFADLADLEL